MARTQSTMLPLGTIAPDFELEDVVSQMLVALKDGHSYPATLIMFICNHCPFVKHINAGLTKLANDYLARGIRFIAINSNDIVNYPDDSPEKMKLTAHLEQYPFPYLFDETQLVAQSYKAACTPDFFVFDKHLALIYRGQLDDSRPGNDIPVTGQDLRQALDCVLANKPLNVEQKPSIGCNIKWKVDSQ